MNIAEAKGETKCNILVYRRIARFRRTVSRNPVKLGFNPERVNVPGAGQVFRFPCSAEKLSLGPRGA